MYREERYRQLYWDEIILKYNPDTCDVYIRECTREDVWEIDTVADLRALEARIRHN